MRQQLTLDFGFQNDKTFSNFVPGTNQELLKLLNGAVASPRSAIFISGPAGVGKTHLLCAACTAERSAAYIALTSAAPEALQGLETLPLICLDDLHSVAGDSVWEEAIFHLFNRALDSNSRLIISSRDSIMAANLRLKDLQSRLSGGLNYQINALSDTEKMTALQTHARIRGINLSSDASRYLINHFTRDMTSLLTLLQQLDAASLSAKRKVTIPFIKAYAQQHPEH